jgi:ADP-heptose:LPS heptosyltransferase
VLLFNKKMSPPKKVLVIRNDKIGDFMLAWPSFALLKTQYPYAEITALVPEYTAPLAHQCEWIDKVLIDKRENTFTGDILSLTKKIKNNNYDVSISLFSETRTSVSLWLAGVKTRIGPATKLAQLFINKKLKQHRSRSAKPEYEYNLDLVRYFIKLNNQNPVISQQVPYLTFSQTETQLIKKQLLTKHNISHDTKLVMIHPGTGGSAINLPLKDYAELANCIADCEQVYFIITAGPDELENANDLSVLLHAPHHIHHSKGSIVDFCKFISITDIFISGSTGPLHIAGALNIRTIAFYPSRKSATSLRWQTLNTPDRRLAFTLKESADEQQSEMNIQAVCKQVCDTYLNDNIVSI